MGNNDSKKGNKRSEDTHALELFRRLSNKKDCIQRSDLNTAWAHQIHSYLFKRIEDYLFQGSNETGFNKFIQLYTELYNGDLDQKVDAICQLTGNTELIPSDSLLQFIESVLSSILQIEKKKGYKNFKSWSSRSSEPNSSSFKLLAASFLGRLDKAEVSAYSKQDLRSLLQQFDVFLNPVLSQLFECGDDSFLAQLYPKWCYTVMESGRQLDEFSVLDLVRVLFINAELPVDFQLQWRLLFSTHIYGESFSRFSGQIINKGPTIIIVQDKDGHIFGAFAPHNWTFGPNFTGDSSCFLFTLYPAMKIFPATVFNDHYQYLNIGQQTLPNGLGFGGQLEYFGLWLDSEFGKGYCSESCSTFRNFKMMSSQKEFNISSAEVWGVGQPPPTAAELGERSVLDGNVEAQAILEMAGKTRYSDGLREVPED